ncbi:hypothetical protein K491DRAFT_674375 [Lophiostoma macrostomum CBS 122681]|uniref:Rhodopsin domain-containing protein n=1 Tax=Lophiostoma macrostomum CBS 122681 TaxID=1314788 RepID=A0A6A6TPH0_9PLEO|nr:hypothetical protein K491DRAFT_674375 [Lophiostoma macrostomum CBS 122681]
MSSSSDILVDYSYLGPGGNIAGSVVMLVLSITAVAARFWGRAKSKIGFKSDDWLILISLVFFVGMNVCIWVGVAGHGLGYRTPKPPAGSPKDAFLYFTSPEQQLAGKMEYGILWQQMWQLGFAKASVLMFYRRIFASGKPALWFTVSTIGLLVLVGLWTVAFFFTILFDCGTHFSAKWTTVIALLEHCHGENEGQMAMSICDFSIDLFIIVLPFPIIWNLHMSPNRKLQVSGVFLLGALAIGASGLRMAMFILVMTSYLNPKQDGAWTVDLFLFWSVIESGLVLLAACLPSLAFLAQSIGVITGSAVRSIRSVFSLQSLRSQGSLRATRDTGYLQTTSQGSQIHMVEPHGKRSADGDVHVSSAHHSSETPGQGISVTRSIAQEEEMI